MSAQRFQHSVFYNAPTDRSAGFDNDYYIRDYEAMREVERFIPHRDPFLFVESVEVMGDDCIRAFRRFTEKDFFFEGHLPHYPLVPGVVLIEAMAQAGSVGVKKMGLINAGTFFLASIDKAKFRRQVRKNDILEMRIENKRVTSQFIKQAGCAYVNGELAAEAEWLCVVGEEI
jgi:3-hydroxyacyl-[acyl-carrier-protein] dehydratase